MARLGQKIAALGLAHMICAYSLPWMAWQTGLTRQFREQYNTYLALTFVYMTVYLPTSSILIIIMIDTCTADLKGMSFQKKQVKDELWTSCRLSKSETGS